VGAGWYPYELSWTIKDSSSSVVLSGGASTTKSSCADDDDDDDSSYYSDDDDFRTSGGSVALILAIVIPLILVFVVPLLVVVCMHLRASSRGLRVANVNNRAIVVMSSVVEMQNRVGRTHGETMGQCPV
jgi:hypothetical protein